MIKHFDIKIATKQLSAKAVVFDMDGVLVDSEPVHFKSCQEFLRPYNVNYSEADHGQFIGTTDEFMWKIYSEKYNIQVDSEQFIQRREEILIGLLKREAVARPGVYELLERLKQREVPIAVASSSSLSTIGVVLEALKIRAYFDVIASGEEVMHGKPAPDVFLLAAERLGLPPADCLVIEDSHNGTKAAKAAGMYCLAVPCDATRNQDLSLADAYAESLSAVMFASALV